MKLIRNTVFDKISDQSWYRVGSQSDQRVYSHAWDYTWDHIGDIVDDRVWDIILLQTQNANTNMQKLSR